MKAWLHCLESTRVSVAAATGSIGSIFDVSMVGGVGHRESADRSQTRPSEKEGSRLVYKESFRAHRAAGGAPFTTVPSDFFVHVAFPRFTPPSLL